MADTRRKLEAAEAELTDLDTAEQIANRRHDVAGGHVAELWDELEAAQRERDDARSDRATVRDEQRRVRRRVSWLQRRLSEIEGGRW